MSDSPQASQNGQCENIQEIVPAYAFGLTTPEEAQLVKSQLTSCPEAAAQLADYQRLQNEMRASVPQLEPPASLEAKLMAAIATPEKAAPRRPKIHTAWWVTAAALIALVVTNVYWLTRADKPAAPRDDSNPIAIQGDSSFMLTSSREIRWVRLPPSQQNVDASAVLMWNVESEMGLLYVRGFPPLSAGKTFQLWLTRGEEKMSAGIFQVNEEGAGALLFHITEAIDQYTWARITEEPENGSPEPGDIVVVNGEL